MIRRLSEDVQGRLRTGVALTGVAQCVEELVLNSVDAGATCVAVRVDLQSVTIQVVDNGAGITKEQLPDVGQRLAMLITCVCPRKLFTPLFRPTEVENARLVHWANEYMKSSLPKELLLL